MEAPINNQEFVVVITGAAGQLGSALVFMVLERSPFPTGRRLVIRLVDIPAMKGKLEGTKMEIEDCCFERSARIEVWDESAEAFAGADCLVLAGGKPRGPNSSRGDLLKDNGLIFQTQGKLALQGGVKSTCKVLVVANPCNTNALIFSMTATNIPKSHVMSMSMLDHLRAKKAVADKLGVGPEEIKDVAVWGNHADSMFVDTNQFSLKSKHPQLPKEWVENDLQKHVRGRGSQVINAKGGSSAYSAARAAWTHLSMWFLGSDFQLVSCGVITSAFGEELCVSIPVVIDTDGEVHQRHELAAALSAAERKLLDATIADLRDEKRNALQSLNK